MDCNFLWLNIRSQFFNVMLKVSFRQNLMSIEVEISKRAVFSLNNFIPKNDCRHLYVQRKRQTTLSKGSQIFSIHSLEAVAKMISDIVCSCDDRKLRKSTFQNRATLQTV